MVDWQIAALNNLESVKVINEEVLIHNGFGRYSGLKADKARELLINDLRERGLMDLEEDIKNNLSICYRCDTPIEPLPSKQWFVGVDIKLDKLGGKSLKEKALEAAVTKEIEFIPERFNKRYQDWMENLHDWCISRQIWFGHSIPVWYKGEEVYCGEVAPDGDGWIQDGDTLDTWFSSGMWTFSTLGWPDNYKNGIKINDLAKFHPTQVLETGYEILTLWVSRMVMMSFFALGEIPFEKVYLHGTILDAKGKKMSKSKGNGVDPLDAINEYGADALRLSLLMGATPGNDSRYSAEKIESKRNFINKLWNISRFILSVTDEQYFITSHINEPMAKTESDKWILNEFSGTRYEVNNYLENFNFSLAAEELTNFTCNKLADWYLEIAKVEKNKDEILMYILKNLLISWHPFIPFVTETIWGSFNDKLLMAAEWTNNKIISLNKSWLEYTEAKENCKLVQDIIIAIRNARSENKIEPAKKLEALIYAHGSTALIESQKEVIKNLKTGLASLDVRESGAAPDKAIMVPVGEIEIYLLGSIDENKEKERLLKEIDNLEKLISIQEIKLANQDFVSRAPASIVTAEKEKLAAYRLEISKLKDI